MTYKILCAVDETDASRKAEKIAVELAKATGNSLTFANVELKAPADTNVGWDATTLDEAAAAKHGVLGLSQKVAKEQGFQAGYMVLKSFKIVSAIINYADKEGYDHIVCGTTGRSGIPRFLIGSVASGILHKAHCPVTVVR